MADVDIDRRGSVVVVTINRPEVRNAVDGPTADLLSVAFRDFDADPDLSVAVLTGAGGYFCAGADLGAVAGGGARMNHLVEDGDGPMGPSRMLLGKPVIAAVEGYAVAGGLELALWCDLRVAADSAVFGVFCRRWGVPLIDGGTVRLPRLVGMGRALDIILTGRDVPAEEALRIGLADRVVPEGKALQAAVELAQEIAALPQNCMRSDRLSAYAQWDMATVEALRNEHRLGVATIESGETLSGAQRFAAGAGRHGAAAPED
ncbi:MAG TPA: crotonase/enoyl-CoA hydratase family protein [Candidatus Dormibacteraeota bacterium]|jgi:enoyl-CoA hydratase|nr:crotonase/enoyl-CoA hydratase family protein [Candidatus Dormibacteraeota bacterium]